MNTQDGPDRSTSRQSPGESEAATDAVEALTEVRDEDDVEGHVYVQDPEADDGRHRSG